MTKLRNYLYSVCAGFMFLCASLGAEELNDFNFNGLWHDPASDGHGISITQGSESYAVIWYLYTRSGDATFVIAEPCEGFPCVSALFQPTASWLGGNLELNDPIGSIELSQKGDKLNAVFDLRGLDPASCFNVSPGGLLFNRCVGTINFTKLSE